MSTYPDFQFHVETKIYFYHRQFRDFARESGESNIFLVYGCHGAFTNDKMSATNLWFFKFTMKDKEMNCRK